MATDSLDLTGKVALVTGASKGIGAAIARIYAEHGARVMLSSRKLYALEETTANIDGETAVYPAHAGDPEQARACIAATIERFGGLDILVNNAATNPYYGRSIDIDLRSLRQDRRGQHPGSVRLEPGGVAAGHGRRRRHDHQHRLHRWCHLQRAYRDLRHDQGRPHPPDQAPGL